MMNAICAVGSSGYVRGRNVPKVLTLLYRLT